MAFVAKILLVISSSAWIGFFLGAVLVRQELEGSVKLGAISEFAAVVGEAPALGFRATKDLLGSDRKINDSEEIKGSLSGEINQFDGDYFGPYYLLLAYFDNASDSAAELALVDLQSRETILQFDIDVVQAIEAAASLPGEEFSEVKNRFSASKVRVGSPVLLPDGSVLFNGALNSGLPLFKADACGDVSVFRGDDHYHHAITKGADETIWALKHFYPYTLPENEVGNDWDFYKDDGFAQLDYSGNLIFEKSITSLFREGGLTHLLFAQGGYNPDPIHVNDVEEVRNDGEYWKKGDVFLSLRHQSMVLLYRPSEDRIVWFHAGEPLYHQHDVDIIGDGQITVFNNRVLNRYGAVAEVVDNNKINLFDFKEGQWTELEPEFMAKHRINTEKEGLHQVVDKLLMIEESKNGKLWVLNTESGQYLTVNNVREGELSPLNWSSIYRHDAPEISRFLEAYQKRGASCD